jgi:hypothetical protein
MVKTGNIRDLTQDELQKRNGQSSLSIRGQSESVKRDRADEENFRDRAGGI